MNSTTTGMVLSSHMSHFGESALDVTEINLQSIFGQLLTRNIKLPTTRLNGERGYNDENFFKFIDSAQMNFMNTVKRSASLPFKFGKCSYKCTKEQKVIDENGPMMIYAAGRKPSSGVRQFFTGFRSGTGKVVFLQSTSEIHRSENFSYEPKYMADYKCFIELQEYGIQRPFNRKD